MTDQVAAVDVVETGWFSIDPAQSSLTTIGRATLSTGFLGEPIARITAQASDGKLHSGYGFRADAVDRRIEYLCHSEIEGAVVRDGTWVSDDPDDSLWAPEDDEELHEVFAAMARLADGPAVVGLENDVSGEIDEEVLAELAPLWTPGPDSADEQ